MSFLAYLPPTVVERRNRRKTPDTTKDGHLLTACVDGAGEALGPSHRL